MMHIEMQNKNHITVIFTSYVHLYNGIIQNQQSLQTLKFFSHHHHYYHWAGNELEDKYTYVYTCFEIFNS